MAYLAAVAFAKGRAKAMAGVFGTAAGLAIVGIIAAVGLAEIVRSNPTVYDALRYAGAAFLLWLAIDAWRCAGATASRQGNGFASFRKMLIANLLNPKAAIFYVAVVPAFARRDSGDSLARNLWLVALYVAIATVVHTAIVVLSARAGAFLSDPARRVPIERALAVALGGVAVWFLFATAS
jgi:threonine/homoserine/homoserine lactone efflux protein